VSVMYLAFVLLLLSVCKIDLRFLPASSAVGNTYNSSYHTTVHMAGVKRGMFTCVGCQVTQPVWQLAVSHIVYTTTEDLINCHSVPA